MPTSSKFITAPLREAYFECYRATTRLVRPDRRRQLVLVGGAASIAHSSRRWAEDVDVAAPPDLIIQLLEVITAGAPNFLIEPDGKIAFDAPQGFRVHLEITQIGEGFIERIIARDPFFEGSVASMSDLLRLRAATVVDRGSVKDEEDFQWLLSKVTSAGRLLPGLNQRELEDMTRAGVTCLGKLGPLVIYALCGAVSKI